MLDRNGQNSLLTVRVGAQTWRLLLGGSVREGEPFAFEILAGSDPRLSCRLISRINALMAPRTRPKPASVGAVSRPNRDAILHMRTMQALDCDAAGVSHREIAELLFGPDEVWQRWGKDSELRSQIRYLLRRGRALVSGGYSRLLAQT